MTNKIILLWINKVLINLFYGNYNYLEAQFQKYSNQDT